MSSLHVSAAAVVGSHRRHRCREHLTRLEKAQLHLQRLFWSPFLHKAFRKFGHFGSSGMDMQGCMPQIMLYASHLASTFLQ